MFNIKNKYREYKERKQRKAVVESTIKMQKREIDKEHEMNLWDARLHAYKSKKQKEVAMVRAGKKPPSKFAKVGKAARFIGKDVMGDLAGMGGSGKRKKASSGMGFNLDANILGDFGMGSKPAAPRKRRKKARYEYVRVRR